jgi:HAD superfamily hydrolase (TIGR01509 family)
VRFDLLILDNDGVLVDSEPIANRVLAELLTEYGRPTTYEESVREFMGGTLGRVREIVQPRLGGPLPDDFEDRYHERLYARMRTELTAIQGVVAALDALDACGGLPMCVASSGTHERIETALATVGLLARFAGRIFSAEDVRRGKPYPDLFLHAAERMGAEPARCVVVEDSPPGVAAAKAAGMTVIGYAGLTPAARLAAADIVIERMSELPSTIRLSAVT